MVAEEASPLSSVKVFHLQISPPNICISPPDDTNIFELQSTTIRVHTLSINLIKIYIPPSSSTPSIFQLNLRYLNT